MNASFETIRKELKKFNAEDNDIPPKIVIAGINDFLDITHKKKRNSQFIIGIKEFPRVEKDLIEKFINDLAIKSAQKPLTFLYDDREIIETVIRDFEDYYNKPVNKNIFQQFGSATRQNECLYYLIIIVLENYYYES